MAERDPFAVPGEQSQLAKWNYSKPKESNYQDHIIGDIVKIAQVQAKNHITGEKEWWPDGNAKLNMLFIIAAEDGNRYPFIFSPRSVAADAVKKGMKEAGIPANSWANVAGMAVKIATEDGQYYQGNPRPWFFTLLGPGDSEFEGCESFQGIKTKQEYDAKKLQQQSVGAMQQAMYQPQPQPQYQQPQPQPQYQQQQMGNGFQTPINVQNPQLQQSMQRAQAAVQMNNGYMQQPQPQYQAQNDPYAGYYDQDIPF